MQSTGQTVIGAIGVKGLAQGPNREITLQTMGFEPATGHRHTILTCSVTHCTKLKAALPYIV